ncbi:MAG TPA: glycosyltransferase, partial [Nitrosopumilaceae archaeon]|nr:glycosyltransferase [Nitrosopumilaceae archaeon]
MKVELSNKKEKENAVKVEIIIPTLNEEKAIGDLIHSIRSHHFPIEVSILVIDGGSTDHTVEICKKENVNVIRQKRKGKGNAMKEAVEYSNADIIVFIDGDGTYFIDDLESMLEPLLTDKADMVVGSRVSGKREKGAISTLNMLGNKLFNKTINFALHSQVTDSLSGYRAMRKEVFEDLVLFSINFEIEVEITVEFLAKGYRIAEVPIKYGVRKGTVTKLNPINDGIKIGRTLLFILMNVTPIKFFGIFCLAFVIIGLYPAGYVIREKIMTGEIVSMPSVVFASLLFVTGA